MLQKKQLGFSVIELMMVVAVIGILAAIAITKYQDYIVKSDVKRLIYEASSLKSNVMICVSENRLNIGEVTSTNFMQTCDPGATFSTLLHNEDISQTGLLVNARGGYIQVSFLEGQGASIAGRFGSNAHAQLSGIGIVWVLDTQGHWTCSMGIIQHGINGVSLARATAMPLNQALYSQSICPAAS